MRRRQDNRSRPLRATKTARAASSQSRELQYGILVLAPGRRRTRLERWFADGVRRLRFLDFETATAGEWARLLAGLKKKGLAMPIKDSLIAASALQYKLSVVTRNTEDFRHAGVPLVNPFEE